MRIVAGSARGRRIESPGGTETRPTSDRVRESMFNSLFSLGAIDGATVLDLFAGSGALGLEALSRGAAHATFVDSSRRACQTVQANVERLGFSDAATVVTADAVSWLVGHPQHFDLIVCDPPYAYGNWAELLDHANGATFVIESNREVEAGDRWGVLRSRRYGSTIVSILGSSPA